MSTIKHAINAEKAKGVTIRFELRNEKTDKQGKAPVRLIFQIKGHRKYYNTGQSLLSQCWDNQNQQAVYINRKQAKELYPEINYELFFTETQATEFNERISAVIRNIKQITDRFILDGVLFSAEMVIEKLKQSKNDITKQSETSNALFDFIDRYIEDNRNTREPGSLTVYKSMRNHLAAYQQLNRKVTFDKINYSFFQSFQSFLIERTKIVAGVEVPMLNNTTIQKQLSTLKTFLNYAKMQGIDVPDGYKNFKITKDKLEVIALTNLEFETLFYLDLSNNQKLDRIRDIFCFACTTGLRYSDMAQLKREHIKDEEIAIRVIKTDQLLTVPLTPYSKAIIQKYVGHHRPLPMISNQKLNDYIKELCNIAGINEPVEIVRSYGIKREAITYPKYELIGVHTGRKTFCTLSLEKGMSAEQVMAISGHMDYQSFKRYVNVTNKLKKVVMLKAWGGELRTNKLKAI